MADTFLKFLIVHLLNDFIPRWEYWKETYTEDEEKELHETLIRLLKGQIRAVRRYLEDTNGKKR